MRKRLERLLDDPRTVWAASAASLALGLFFVFVWSPLPWGWEGIDHYHDRAIRLAEGRPFDTTDVPWGYAYFVAFFYRLFGPAPVASLIGQVALNATLPLIVVALARPLVGGRIATLAALLTGVLSFNTVYTSILSADSVCTVLFAVVMLAYLRGRQNHRAGWFALAGALAGAAAQFRPNLVLFPIVLAGIEAATARGAWRRLWRSAVIAGCAAAVLSPWVARNYRLTGEFLPTSTHGGVQLWYGSLQVGPYLESRAHNPRSAFESAPFDYTSLAGRSIIVTGRPQCPGTVPETPTLVVWTDRAPAPIRLRGRQSADGVIEFEVPAQPAPTAVYYYFEARFPDVPGSPTQTTPEGGRTNPRVFFVSDDHLGDLDRHGDVLDIFDVIRLLRAEAWGEASPADTGMDLTTALRHLLPAAGAPAADADRAVVESAADGVTLRLSDGSWLRVPRDFTGKVTDLAAEGRLAQLLLYARRLMTAIDAPPPAEHPCAYLEDLAANAVFYRREPHNMRRYGALALDNIRRDPMAFAAASAYRAIRLFVIRGSDDLMTTQQFSASRIIYAAGTAASLAYFVAMAVGMAIALRRNPAVWVLALPIVYVPLTIAPVLTNMRYSITVQPFAFAFVAVALLSAWRQR